MSTALQLKTFEDSIREFYIQITILDFRKEKQSNTHGTQSYDSLSRLQYNSVSNHVVQ